MGTTLPRLALSTLTLASFTTLASGPAPKRAPAVHAGGHNLQDEPSYCEDLAQDFCAQIPRLGDAKARESIYSGHLHKVVSGAESKIASENFFEHLKTSLQKKGFPLLASIKAADIERYFAQRNGLVDGDFPLEKLFQWQDPKACAEGGSGPGPSAPASVLKDLGKLVGPALPSDEAFDMLAPTAPAQGPAMVSLHQKIQSLPVGHGMLKALGDYQIEEVATFPALGLAYVELSRVYTGEISSLVVESRRQLAAAQGALQEQIGLCYLLQRGGDGEEDVAEECEVTPLLDVYQAEGTTFAAPKAENARKLIDSQRKLWNLYQNYLAGKPVSDASELQKKTFSAWKARKVTSEADFSASIKKYVAQDQVRKDTEDQLRPFQGKVTASELQAQMLCNSRTRIAEEALSQEYERVQRVLKRSAAYVEQVTEGFYPKADVEAQNTIFANVRARAQIQFEKLATGILDPDLRKRLSGAFRNIRIYDPRRAEAGFTQDPWTNIKMLDYAKVSDHDPFYSLFLSGDFSDVGVINAYLDSPHLAQLGSHDGLYLTPAHFAAYRDNQASLLLIYAHELGHLLDPRMFRQIGQQFPKAYQKILECFAKKESVGVQPHQHGECFADWFSAEVLASTLSDLKPEQRFNFAQDALVSTCEQMRVGSLPRTVRSEGDPRFSSDSHVTPRRRINSIIGAHPVVREALGCRLPMPNDAPYCSYSDTGAYR